MIDREEILKLLRSKKTRPLNRQELSHRLRIPPQDKKDFFNLLDFLEKRGKVIRVKGGRYAIPGELGLVVGKLEVNPRGFGFVRPEEARGDDIYIHSEDMSTALHGDRVLVRPRRERRRGPSGRVVRVIERGREAIVGTLVQSGRMVYVIPDNPAFIHDVYLDPSRPGRGRPGDKVRVRIVNWPSRHLNPEGEILEVLGRAGVPAVDTLSVIRQYELREEFPEGVKREAKKAARAVTPPERRGREDLRDKTVFTIDPDDARDFDDAVSLEKTEEGNWLLGVHISDVSHYVKPKTALDEEARARGTSVYFPARVLHMLPPELSTATCSLRPGEEKLTQSVFITFDSRGERLGYRFLPSLIRSRRRFTYREVRKIVVDRDEPARKSDPGLTAVLDDMACLSRILRGLRFARGAFNLDLPEEKIVFDREGLIKAIELEGEDLAHSLVEEFMLAANEAAAELLARRKAPLIYRVHDKPDARDLREFVEFAGAFGFQIKNPKNRREIQSFLDLVQGQPLGYTLQTAFLRSLKRAEYSAENIGHFGLSSKRYTYFTSPIRRYPDLHTHRLIKQVLRGEKPSFSGDLKEAALHYSETERAAEKAEREMVLLRKLQFFQRQLKEKEGAVFEGVITGIKNFGIKVYINQYLIGGLVHVSTLTDDFYRPDRSRTALMGRRTKRKFRIGDLIRVRVGEVDMIKRQVDFIIFPAEKL